MLKGFPIFWPKMKREKEISPHGRRTGWREDIPPA